jgi:hypothetical protein
MSTAELWKVAIKNPAPPAPAESSTHPGGGLSLLLQKRYRRVVHARIEPPALSGLCHQGISWGCPETGVIPSGCSADRAGGCELRLSAVSDLRILLHEVSDDFQGHREN